MLIAAFILAAASFYFLSFIPIIMWILTALFITVGVFVSSVYLPLYFSTVVYYITDKNVIKKSGVFYNTKQVIRVSDIQFTFAMNTLFSALTGLNFIVLNTFGGRIILPFLSKSDLDEIMEFIESSIINKKKGGEHDASSASAENS